MAEFCRAMNMQPSEYKALTLSEYQAFIKDFSKRG
jgi:hypothetical protein